MKLVSPCKPAPSNGQLDVGCLAIAHSFHGSALFEKKLLFPSLPFGLLLHGCVLVCPCGWSPVCETLRISYLLRDQNELGPNLCFSGK